MERLREDQHGWSVQQVREGRSQNELKINDSCLGP